LIEFNEEKLDMDNLEQTLRIGPLQRGVFSPSEMNEIILMIYNKILRAIREGSDTFTLTPTHFIWSKKDHIIGEHSIIDLKPTMSFQHALELIMARDKIMQEHFHLVSKTAGTFVFDIVR
jgi:hypothetical protein